MGRYQDLLTELLDEVRRIQGEGGMKRTYEGFKEEGMEAMSRELVVKILGTLTPETREEFFVRHPDIQADYNSRLS